MKFIKVNSYKETDLKHIFGIKGYWIPDELIRGKRVKVPVAIKILKNDNDVGSDTELLKVTYFCTTAICRQTVLVGSWVYGLL